ncbi:MAG: nucleotidyltransferase domain-containing protein [Vicinamibacterales bacterium]
MSTDSIEVASVAARLVRDGARAVWLFGSAARGEARLDSDVDVLIVVDAPTEPFAIGDVQVAPYTFDRLCVMATHGSLFIRHLLDEARPLRDDGSLLSRLRAAYVETSPHNHLREIRVAAGLLDVNDAAYIDLWPGLHACAGFLLRSLAYLEARRRGCFSFSMVSVLEALGDPTLESIQMLRSASAPNTILYRQALASIERYQEMPVENRFISIEALTVNSWRSHELAYSWGLRILTRNASRVAYG